MSNKNGKISGVVVNGIRQDLPTHAADLDAHMADMLQTLRTGENIYTLPLSEVDQSQAISANYLYGSPFFVARPLTVSAIKFDVATAAAAGSRLAVALYNNGSNMYPGTLLQDGGNALVDATGTKTLTLSSAQALARGWYWIAFDSDGAPTITASWIDYSPLGRATNLRRWQWGWSAALAYQSPLPATFTAAGGKTTVRMPIFTPVLDSLD